MGPQSFLCESNLLNQWDYNVEVSRRETNQKLSDKQSLLHVLSSDIDETRANSDDTMVEWSVMRLKITEAAMMIDIRKSDWIRNEICHCAAMGICIIINFGAHAQSLCMATYNLNYGNRRGDQVLDAISKAAPDLICFQESTMQSEQFLRDNLAKDYPFFHSVGHEGKYYAERFAFACKTKLTDVEFVPPTKGLFGFYLATLEVGRDARVPTSEIGREKTHAVEIDAILKRVDEKRPTIILGDFNSLSSFVAPKRLKELGFKDAFAALHSKPDSHPTWTWPTKPIPISLRIDYIFHTDHFIAQKSEVVRREGSDHFLLFAEFDFATKEGNKEALRP